MIRHPEKQKGAALLLVLFIALTLGLAFFFRPGDPLTESLAREKKAQETMTVAKDALIGKAVSDAANGALFGLLPLPDLGSTRNTTPGEGETAGNFTGNDKDISIIGRLPWRTLGLPPLRDANGECLWYAISGGVQAVQFPAVFNWDSIGHFNLFSSDGTSAGTLTTTGNNPHDRPLAILFSAGPPLAGQDRSQSSTPPTDNVAECGGNYDVRNYLDTYDANANTNNIVNYFAGSTNNASGNASAIATPKSIISGTVESLVGNDKTRIANDQLLAITSKDIFDLVKKRPDFKSDIDSLLDGLTIYLNTLTLLPPNLPTASGSKGIAGVVGMCMGDTTCPIRNNAHLTAVLANWKDNLLYAGGPSGNFTVNGVPDCKAVLIFGGERTLRTEAPLVAQTRATSTDKDDPGMYLEGSNAGIFPNDGNYSGASKFDATTASKDIVRCVTGLPPGATQKSFASDFGSFVAAGPSAPTGSPGSVAAIVADSAEQTLAISSAAGPGNGCFWLPTPIPLAGKTLRAFYEFQFSSADTYATTGAPGDRGNGFTFQFVRGDIPDAWGTLSRPVPSGSYTACGSVANLGALDTADSWGTLSYIVETDVRESSSRYHSGANPDQSDPRGNHTAITTNGSLDHSPVAALPTACDGTANICQATPANTFEESPSPLLHNQRVEIHTGCNSTCARCNPGSSGAYAKVSTWVDCTDCGNVVADLTEPELIATQADRDFSALGHWSGSNWLVTANALNHSTAGTTSAASLPNSALNAAAVAGKTYRVDVSIRTDTPGTLTVAFGGASSVLNLGVGDASYRLQIVASSAGKLSFKPDATWSGGVTRVSVKPVRPASANRCVHLYPEMYTGFFGFTGGFLSGTDTAQGVTIKNLYLRTD